MSAKYLLVAEELRRMCAQMRQCGQTKLPTEYELCEQFTCSRQTVRHAMDLLEREGLLTRRHGSGSYLSNALYPENRRIALVTARAEEYLYPQLIREIGSQLSAASYRAEVYSTENQLSREREILGTLLSDPPAAILLEGTRTALPCSNLDLFQQILSRKIPLVFLSAPYRELEQVPCITQDDAGGAALLVRYLLKKKHKNIAAIFKYDDIRGLARYRGYVSALQQSSLPLHEQNIFWYNTEDFTALADNQSDMLERFVRQRLSPCTAVICYNDEIAYHLIRCLLRLGRRVPDDVAVLSFDDSYYCGLGPIPISSLGHERHTLSQAAADAILCAAKHKNVSGRSIPWVLKERESG